MMKTPEVVREQGPENQREKPNEIIVKALQIMDAFVSRDPLRAALGLETDLKSGPVATLLATADPGQVRQFFGNAFAKAEQEFQKQNNIPKLLELKQV